jgi:hypothetical protein
MNTVTANTVTVWYHKCFNAWGAVVNYNDVAYATEQEARFAREQLSKELRGVVWIEEGRVERHVNQPFSD